LFSDELLVVGQKRFDFGSELGTIEFGAKARIAWKLTFGWALDSVDDNDLKACPLLVAKVRTSLL